MMSGMSEPSPELISKFVVLDYDHNMAFAAVVGEGASEHFIGVARYAVDGEARCEYAVSVLDSWQSRGVGSALTVLLFDYARSRGIKNLHCEILATNQRMMDFAKWLGMSIHRRALDACVVEGFRAL
jgi:GNAT superfamily N-acetyltransferase